MRILSVHWVPPLSRPANPTIVVLAKVALVATSQGGTVHCFCAFDLFRRALFIFNIILGGLFIDII